MNSLLVNYKIEDILPTVEDRATGFVSKSCPVDYCFSMSESPDFPQITDSDIRRDISRMAHELYEQYENN